MSPISYYHRRRSSIGVGGSHSSQASAFIARTSGLSQTETNAYYNLIDGLVSDGNFSVLDGLYIFATNTIATAKLNLIQNAFNLTDGVAPTFTADQGYTGDGSTTYLETGFNPSTAGGNYAVNSCSVGAYVLSARTSTLSVVPIGGGETGGGSFTYVAPRDSSGTFSISLNATTPDGVAVANSQGMFIGTRTGPTTNVGFRNGLQYVTSNTASGTLSNETLLILAGRGGSNSVIFNTPDQVSAALFGGGLTNTRMAQISSRLNVYMTALGINVY